jgi:hypothetical protein
LTNVSEVLSASIIRAMSKLHAKKSGLRYRSRLDKAEGWPDQCELGEDWGEDRQSREPMGEGVNVSDIQHNLSPFP